MRAGAIPLLTKTDGFDGLRALSVAACDLAAAHDGDPSIPLMASLATWTLEDRPVFPPQTTEQLKSLLQDSPEKIGGFVAEAFRRHTLQDQTERPYDHLLLTIDHAEALVASADIAADARDRFERILLTLCACPHVLVAMIVRGDFYPKLSEALPALIERKAGDGHLDVFTPRHGEIGEIIRRPAWTAELGFETDPDTLTRLDDALRDAAVAQPDALPLLQHTLQTLYERRNDQQQLTFAAYNAIGGIEGAIAHRAEQVYAALPEEARARLDTVLAKLIVIQPDSDAVSARRADLDVFDADARALIDAFIAARLFVGDQHNGRPTIGVVHEALLRRWPRAAEWAQDNRRLLQAKARLERAARRWTEEGRSPDHLLNPGRPLMEAREAAQRLPGDVDVDTRAFLHASEGMYRRKRTLRRSAIIALVVLAISASGLAIFALQSRNEAEWRRQEAQRLANFMLDDLAFALRSQGQLELLDGIVAEAMAYLEHRDPAELNQKETTSLSVALSLAGETAMKKGDTKPAKTALVRARNVARHAMSSDPSSTKALLAYGVAEYWLGQEYFDQRDYREALVHWQEYFDVSRKLTSIESGNPAWTAELSQAYGNLSAIAIRQQRYSDAEELLEESLRLIDSAIAGNRRREDWKFLKATLMSWQATNFERTGKLEDASRNHAETIDYLRRTTDLSPDQKEWEQELTSSLMHRANLALNMGRTRLAEDLLRECIARLTSLVSEQPNYRMWQYQLANAHTRASEVARFAGEADQQARHLEFAKQYIGRLAPLRPSESRLDAHIRLLSARLSDDHARRDTSIRDLERIFAGKPEDTDARSLLSNALIMRGRDHARARNKSAAVADWVRARKVLGDSADTSSDIRILAPLVLSRALLGEREYARLKHAELSRIGFAHPDFEEILGVARTPRPSLWNSIN